MINKILIANRGEIAVRIIRSAKALGIATAVVYTRQEKSASYLQDADDKYLMNGESLQETYLNKKLLIQIAKKIHVDAIHPGYGFLSEDADFAQQCVDNGITWIGPSPQVMRLMAYKASSRAFAKDNGVPLLDAAVGTAEELKLKANSYQFPILIKAVAGGGGRCMRAVKNADDFSNSVDLVSREAQKLYGNPIVFVERYIQNAKHIEVQVFGDKHGNVVHLFERECSIQRRFQKIIEESPSPTLNDEIRKEILETSVRLAKAAGYDNAGTIEYLLDDSGNYYFIEMNTRIQVEHPVTEMTTGIDLVKEQIQVAVGNPLSFSQQEIQLNGHSVECRICAENTSQSFSPSPGFVSLYMIPQQADIRIDSVLENSSVVTADYDSMVAKLITHGANRKEALLKMINALNSYVVQGIDTNIEYLQEIIQHEQFVENQFYTNFIAKHHQEIEERIKAKRHQIPRYILALAYAIQLLFGNRISAKNQNNSKTWNLIGYWRLAFQKKIVIENIEIRIELIQKRGDNIIVSIDDNVFEAAVISVDSSKIEFECNSNIFNVFYSKESLSSSHFFFNGFNFTIVDPLFAKSNHTGYKKPNIKPNSKIEDPILSPLPGKVIKIMVKSGDLIKMGHPLAIIESMKTENHIMASFGGLVDEIFVNEGQQVKVNQPLFKIQSE